MRNQDRNFDDISHKFSKNIYGSSKGKIREVIVWQEIESMLATFPKEQKLTILDAGGGQGQIACKLAKLGHTVIICDISMQMLTVAKATAAAESVTLTYCHCAIQDISKQISQPFDIVICHAVLEWVEDPQNLLQSLKNLLKADGVLSLMFYNLHALLFKTVTLGNFGYVQSGLNKRKKKTLSPDFPRNPDDVYLWLNTLHFTIIQKTGVRVFHDYLIDKSKQQTCFDELLELEKQFCKQKPYLDMARYILITAIKND